jgi:hypothetical protein
MARYLVSPRHFLPRHIRPGSSISAYVLLYDALCSAHLPGLLDACAQDPGLLLRHSPGGLAKVLPGHGAAGSCMENSSVETINCRSVGMVFNKPLP